MNTLMIVGFSLLVPRIRAVLPKGHTLPEYLGARLGRSVHVLTTANHMLMAPFLLFYNLAAVGLLIAALSPLSYRAAVLLFAAVFTCYAMVSGLRSSIRTDYLQLIVLSLLGVVLAPLVFHRSGGAAPIAAALPALGEKGTLFSKTALVQLALPSIATALLTVSDTTLWQRVWAVKATALRRAYVFAGGLVLPYSLTFGVFGVVALVHGIHSQSGNGNDITSLVAARFLPPMLALPFLIAVVAAGASSSDSVLCAFSSIAMTDVYRRYLRPRVADRELLLAGRVAMVLCAAIGVRLAMWNMSFLETLWLTACLGAAAVFPLVASLYWRRVEAVGFMAGWAIGGVAGVAANLLIRGSNPAYATIGMGTAIAVSALVCSLCAVLRKLPFDFADLQPRSVPQEDNHELVAAAG